MTSPDEQEMHHAVELLSTICHDLRAPLSAIMMGSTFLLRQLGEESTAKLQVDAARKMADAIRRSAGRMDRVIGDYHDLARIEDERIELALQAYDLRALLEAACEALRAPRDEEPIAIDVSVPEPLNVRADRARVMQVVEKLARNAADAAPKAPVRVSAEAAGDAVLVRVEDTGPGIDAEVLPHLFDYRWHASRRARRGTGLGLAIARGLVAAMGGELRLERTGASGTSFVFTLPRA